MIEISTFMKLVKFKLSLPEFETSLKHTYWSEVSSSGFQRHLDFEFTLEMEIRSKITVANFQLI